MPRELFEAGLIVDTLRQDPDEVPGDTIGWDLDIFEMAKLPFEVHIRGVHTSHLQLSSMHYHAAVMIDGSYPDGSVTFSSVQTSGLIHEKNRSYGNHDIIILNDNKPFDLIISKPCRIYTLAIEKEILEREFEALFKVPFEEVYKKQNIYLDPEESEACHTRFIEQMVMLKHGSEKRIFGKEDYAELEITILRKLLASFRFRPREISCLPKYIRDGRILLRRNINATYTIADLIDDLRISKRTIQHGFKHYLGFTPKEYQQHIRLNGIRKSILETRDPLITLSEIAANYNYTHPGHFSAEYKKFFGESPSETLRRVRNN